MTGTDAFFSSLGPHLFGLTLCALRILPVTVLCPLLGGAALTSTVRLALTLALSGALHFSGARAPADATRELGAFMVAAGSELLLGTTLGFLASLPFDAARVAGRFIDTFRGASAEVALPLVGSREAASGELLHQLLLVSAVVTGAMGDFMRALWVSFRMVPLGTFATSDLTIERAVSAVGATFAVALIAAAPVACLALLIDAGVSIAARLAAKLSLHELAPALRLLAGAAVLWLSAHALSSRLLANLSQLPEQLSALWSGA